MNTENGNEMWSKQQAWAAEIQNVLDGSAKLPVDRWTNGVAHQGYTVCFNISDDGITICDHTVSNLFAISPQTFTTCSAVQVVIQFIEARDAAFTSGLLDRSPIGPLSSSTCSNTSTTAKMAVQTL